jgi:sugar lactone lactonase YvrE
MRFQKKIIFLPFILSFLLIACKEKNLSEYDDPNPMDKGPAVIEFITPDLGYLRDTVLIIGSGFDTKIENNMVRFGSQVGEVLSASENELRVVLPYISDESLDVQVAVKGAVEWSNGLPFIFKPAIVILDEEIQHPCGVAVDKNKNVYMGGRIDKSIFKFNENGERSVFVSDIPVNGALHFGPGGYLYVCEQDDGKIVKISPDGTVIEDVIEVEAPIDFDWDANGNMYIVSNWVGIYKLDTENNLTQVAIISIPRTCRVYNNILYVTTSWDNQILKFDITNNGLENEEVIAEPENPIGIEIDRNGTIYYTQASYPDLYTIDSEGNSNILYQGLLSAPMRFLKYNGKFIYGVNTGFGDVGQLVRIYVGIEQSVRYGMQ